MKELTKVAAKRSNSSSQSPASHIPATAPWTSETTPNVLQPSLLKQPAIRKPSLFHPSNIQLSSTPMKDAALHRSADRHSLLLDGENDPPISGHHFSSSGSGGSSRTNHDERQLDRISPIHDQSDHSEMINGSDDKIDIVKSSGNEAKNAKVQEQAKTCAAKSEPPDLSVDKQPLTPEDGKIARDHETKYEQSSACSCRSLNSSFVTGQHWSAQLDSDRSLSSGCAKLDTQLPRLHNAASVHRPMSDSQKLFAETKARMASARTNISEFLQSQKTCTTPNSSFTSKLGTSLVNHRDMGRVVGIDVSESRDAGLLDKLPLVVHQSASAASSVSFDEVTCPPAPAFAVEAASVSCPDDHCQLNSGGRSWADVLEQSSDRSTTQRVTAAVPLPDLSCSGDDVVTPAMLDSLKARIRQLKRRQDQLEREQLLPTTRDYLLTTATTNPYPTTSFVMNLGIGLGSKHGADLSGSAVPDVSVRDDCSKNRLQNTSAARSLMFEFTKPQTSSSENSSLPPAPCTSDVASYANISSNYCGSYCQNPASSWSSNHEHDMLAAGAKSGTLQHDGVTMATMSVDGPTISCGPLSPSAHAAAMPAHSLPGKPEGYNHPTCLLSDDVDPASVIMPDIGSSDPTTRLLTMQPTNEEVMSVSSAASTVLISSGDARCITTATVVSSNTLSSNSCENLQPCQSAVMNARTPAGAAAAPLLVGSRLDSADRTVDSNSTASTAVSGVLNPTHVSCSVTSQSLDHQSSEASLSSATTSQKVTLHPLQTYHNVDDQIGNSKCIVENSQHVVIDAVSELPVSTRGSGMIQQSVEDEQRQKMRYVSVFKPFSFMCAHCSVIIVSAYF